MTDKKKSWLPDRPFKKIVLTPEQAQRFLSCFWEEALEIAAKRIAEKEKKTQAQNESE